MRTTASTTARTTATILMALLVVASAACASTSTGAATTASTAAGTSTTASPGTAPSGTSAATAPGGSTPGRAAAERSSAPPKPSAGCGSSTVRALDAEKKTMTVAGVERFYLLTTPPAHDGTTPLPVVLDFHGLSEGAQVHTKMSEFGTLAKKEGFVVAFPNGTGQPVRWDASTASNPNHDVEFVDQLLDQLGAQLCIDTSRVYAAGLSYGAIMSSFLTCVRADRFAAVAPVAGLTVPANCNPSRPMPAVTFHGTADPILLFNGGVDLGAIPGNGGGDTPTTTRPPADINGPGYPAAVAQWAQRNGCAPNPTDTKVSEHVIHRVYDCPADAAVEFYIVLGGGHAWPGSEFSKSIEKVVGPTTFEVSATDVAWQFFQRFHR